MQKKCDVFYSQVIIDSTPLVLVVFYLNKGGCYCCLHEHPIHVQEYRQHNVNAQLACRHCKHYATHEYPGACGAHVIAKPCKVGEAHYCVHKCLIKGLACRDIVGLASEDCLHMGQLEELFDECNNMVAKAEQCMWAGYVLGWMLLQNGTIVCLHDQYLCDDFSMVPKIKKVAFHLLFKNVNECSRVRVSQMIEMHHCCL